MDKPRIWKPGAGPRVRLRLWWQFLYLRKDELHCTYNSDPWILYHLTPYGVQWYFNTLGQRRHIAHVRDLDREDRQRDG